MNHIASAFLSGLPGQKLYSIYAYCRPARLILSFIAFFIFSLTSNGANLVLRQNGHDLYAGSEPAPEASAGNQNIVVFDDINQEEENPVLKENYSIYPNPAGRILNVETLEFPENPIELEIFDISGKLVFTYHHEGARQGPIQIFLDDLRSGMYFLRIHSGNVFKTIRFIKE